jgi:hypothetical protein
VRICSWRFYHILKTGCRAEHARLRTAERLVKLIAVYCILAWRARGGRAARSHDRSRLGADLLVAPSDRSWSSRTPVVPDLPAGERSLFAYVVKLARLGGYLARSRDPPPGA